MSEWQANPEATSVLAEDERWLLVLRIVSSHHFQKAHQLREILLYLCRRAIESSTTAISEYDVACGALGRRPDFNTNEDNIVRVQVRHLRKKLEDYFATDGRHEPILVTIPKGSYLPVFAPRVSGPLESSDSPPGGQDSSGGPRYPWLVTVLLSVLLILMTAVAAVLWIRNSQLQRPVARDGVAPAEDPLWSKIFAPGQQTSIVVADTNMVMLQDILDKDISLREYFSGTYPGAFLSEVRDDRLREALQLITARQYTSLGDLIVAERLTEVGHRYHAQPGIRYARHLHTREFQAGNFILIGSRRGDPWLQLFEPQLNFSLEQDAATRKFRIRNKAPRAGEPAVYGTDSYDESYAVIALVPNLSGTGSVLLLSGITMEMTEAAGELIVRPEFSAELDRILRSHSQESPYFEILMQAKTLEGTARDQKIVTYRFLASTKPAQ